VEYICTYIHWVVCCGGQNGSTARDIAAQQGYRAVAELLAEYERRMTTSNSTGAAAGAPSDDPRVVSSEMTSQASSSTSATGVKLASRGRRPPAVYNRDVIPSPKNSPLKTCTPPLDQYLRGSSSKHSSHWPSSFTAPAACDNVTCPTWSQHSPMSHLDD